MKQVRIPANDEARLEMLRQYMQTATREAGEAVTGEGDERQTHNARV